MILKADNSFFSLEFCEKMDDAGFVKYRTMLSSYHNGFFMDSSVWLTMTDLSNFVKFLRSITIKNGFTTHLFEDQSYFPLEMDFRIIFPVKWNLLEKQKTLTHIMLSCLFSCIDRCFDQIRRYDFGISDWFLKDSVETFALDIEKELLLRYK